MRGTGLEEANTATQRGNFLLSLFSPIREVAAALEAYVFSDAALRDVQRLSWVPVPNATQRRRQVQLRACMQGHAPSLTSDLHVARKVASSTELSTQATSPQAKSLNTSVEPIDSGASLKEDSTSSGTQETLNSGEVVADTLRLPFGSANRTVPAYWFSPGTFPPECWDVLGNVTTPLHHEERSTLFVLAAVFSFFSQQFHAWAAAASYVEGERHHASLLIRNSSNTSITAGPVPFTAQRTPSANTFAPLTLLLHACRPLVAAMGTALSHGLHLLLSGNTAASSPSSSFLPAKDSLMGALATNAQWRLQVELVLVATVGFLLVFSFAVSVRYRKYTRTVELWHAVEARHHAAEAKAWVSEMESCAFRLPSAADSGRSGVWGKSYTFPPTSHVFHSSGPTSNGGGSRRPSAVAEGGQELDSSGVHHPVMNGALNGVSHVKNEAQHLEETPATSQGEAQENGERRKVVPLISPSTAAVEDAPAAQTVPSTLADVSSGALPARSGSPLNGHTAPQRHPLPISQDERVALKGTSTDQGSGVHTAVLLDVLRADEGDELSGGSARHHSTTRTFDEAESSRTNPFADGASVLRRVGSSASI